MNLLVICNSLLNLCYLFVVLEVQCFGNIISVVNYIYLLQLAVIQGLVKLECELDLLLFECSVNGLYVIEVGEIFLQCVECVLIWIKVMEGFFVS